MPRIVFGEKGAYETWLKDHAETRGTKPRYEMYITSMFDSVMIPKVSTSPRVFAVYRGTSLTIKDVEKLAEELKIPTYHVKDVEWDTEKQVGVETKR